MRVVEGQSYRVTSVRVTPGGRRAVSGSMDETLRVWDLETWTCLRVLEGHSGFVTSVSVTQDGRRAVSGSWDKTLRVWVENTRSRRIDAGSSPAAGATLGHRRLDG